MMPSETGATRTGPRATGRFAKSAGNGNSSWVHTSPAPARSTSETPRVRMSTSKCVAEIAWRMIRRSIAQPSAAAATTATSSTTTRGRRRRW